MYPQNKIFRMNLPYQFNQTSNVLMPLFCTVADLSFDYLECSIEAENLQVVSTGGISNYAGFVRVALPKFKNPNN